MELVTRTTPPDAETRHPGPMPAGRRCSHPGCITPLSRYNPTDACSHHGGWVERIDGRNYDRASDVLEVMEMVA